MKGRLIDMRKTTMRGGVAVACAAVLAAGGAIAIQAPAQAEAKVKPPAKVQVKSVKRSGDTVTVKVRKAKRAKGYQYKVTIGKRSWASTVRRTTGRVEVGSSAAGSVKVRAYAYSRPGDKRTWGKWSKAVKVKAAGKTGTSGEQGGTKTDTGTELPAPKYSYRVRFLKQPLASKDKLPLGGVAAYVETGNPDPYFSIKVVDESGSVISRSTTWRGGPSRYSKPCTPDASPTAERLGDGYIVRLEQFGEPGRTYRVVATEYPESEATGDMVKTFENGYAFIKDSTSAKTLGTVTVGDYDAEVDAWMDSVIDEVCDRSLPKGEQMQQIAEWLRKNSVYETYASTESQLFTLAAGNNPWRPWQQLKVLKRMRYDSAGSPAWLCDFGKRLGYPLVDLFGYSDAGTNLLKQKAADEYPALQPYVGKDRHGCAWSPDDNRFFSAIPSGVLPWDDGAGHPRQARAYTPDTYPYYYDLQ